MTYAPPAFPEALPPLPDWIARPGPQGDAVFGAGAALGHLHLVLRAPDLPLALLRQRLALRAAEAGLARAGRPERAADLRDAVHLLRPGDRPGPAGAVCLSWMRAVERPISAKALHRALPDHAPEQITAWLAAGQGSPVARAAQVFEAMRADQPRAGAEALILADAALARGLGWSHVLPLLALGLTARDLGKSGDDLQGACHRALVGAVREVLTLADDLTRRAARLGAVAPKLRARGAAPALALFLSSDALAAAALSGVMSGRAARRLCDRLVGLGAVRELTGRDTFRLYGL
ncbi:MAG: DUF1403 family protein [Rhodobacteraceae bacterium]|nr:MAG: DUF1403 family protein [Paracoccaceae bacterium]